MPKLPDAIRQRQKEEADRHLRAREMLLVHVQERNLPGVQTATEAAAVRWRFVLLSYSEAANLNLNIFTLRDNNQQKNLRASELDAWVLLRVPLNI